MQADYATDKAILGKLHSLGRKMILWSGLAEDVISPAGSVNCYERVKAAAGGEAEVQKFLRMVNMPGMGPQLPGPRVHGQRQQQHGAHARPARQRQPDAHARTRHDVQRAGGLSGTRQGPG